MFPTLLASGSEPVGGLLGGLGEAVLARLVAGVGLVGHDLVQRCALSCSAVLQAMKLLQRAAMPAAALFERWLACSDAGTLRGAS